MTAPRRLTIRGVPAELARALEAEARRRKTSVNRTVEELLRRGLGLAPGRAYDNGLGALAGTWSPADLKRCEDATRCLETVDEEMWRRAGSASTRRPTGSSSAGTPPRSRRGPRRRS